MEQGKINIKILKSIIFVIAKNNGATLSDIATSKKLDEQTIEEQSNFLKNLDLLELGPQKSVKFKQNLDTLKKIANILDNKELSRFMKTQFYKDNFKNYYTGLIKSLDEHRLYPLPDAEYIEYALRNSPSIVRFFLIDNDIKELDSFYQRCISSESEKVKEKIKIQLFEEYKLYLIWDNIVFGKIQEDIQNKVLLDPVNYFAGYLPLAKKTFDKLLELQNRTQKESKGNNPLDSKLKKYLNSLKLIT